MRPREVERAILRLGGREMRRRGSDRLYEAEREWKRARTIVAFHPGDVPTGTLRQIVKDMEPVFGKGWLR